jgi:hypothetical protein
LAIARILHHFGARNFSTRHFGALLLAFFPKIFNNLLIIINLITVAQAMLLVSMFKSQTVSLRGDITSFAALAHAYHSNLDIKFSSALDC